MKIPLFKVGPNSPRSRMIWCLIFSATLFLSPYLKDANNSFPVWYYCLLFFSYNFKSTMKHMMTVSSSAYFCRVSDPRYGGIYLTLLWTMIGIGNSWTVTLSLYFVDILTVKTCIETIFVTKLDEFYVEIIICIILGVLWLFWARKVIYNYEKLKPSAWLVERNEVKIPTDESRPIVRTLSRGDA